MKIKKMIIVFMTIGIICMAVNTTQYTDLFAAKLIKISAFGLHDLDGWDRYSWLPHMKNYYAKVKNATVNTYDYFTKDSLNKQLKEADYLYIHTHGLYDDRTDKTYALKCVDKNKNITKLTLDSVNKTSKTQYKNLKVLYLGACGSAEPNHNMAKSFYEHGAKCVIGYTVSVQTDCNRTAIDTFNSYFATGTHTVNKAYHYAMDAVYRKYGKFGFINSYVIWGDSSLKFVK